MERTQRAVDRVLKALADPTRLRIVGLLQAGEVCVCHIHDSLRISQPKASRHLAYLRRAGVVQREKRGLWVYYRVAPQASPVIQALLDAAIHCTTHLPTTIKDSTRLAGETGAACVMRTGAPCCAPGAADASFSPAHVITGRRQTHDRTDTR